MIAHADVARRGQTLIADKGYRSAAFEEQLNAAGIALIRPATRTESPRPGRRFLRPLRQIIESINQTLKAQLGLERHGGRTRPGVAAACPATTPRPHRRHLAQPNHPPTRPRPLPHRLRPLTPWNYSSSGVFLGVALMTCLTVGLGVTGVSTFQQQMAIGVALVVAVLISQIRGGRIRRMSDVLPSLVQLLGIARRDEDRDRRISEGAPAADPARDGNH